MLGSWTTAETDEVHRAFFWSVKFTGTNQLQIKRDQSRGVTQYCYQAVGWDAGPHSATSSHIAHSMGGTLSQSAAAISPLNVSRAFSFLSYQVKAGVMNGVNGFMSGTIASETAVEFKRTPNGQSVDLEAEVDIINLENTSLETERICGQFFTNDMAAFPRPGLDPELAFVVGDGFLQSSGYGAGEAFK